MKHDVQTREDITLFIHQFYSKLLKDDKLQHFFKEIVDHGNLQHHLIVIVDFWEDILLKTTNYSNNAMKPHLTMHKSNPFLSEHFDAWLHHFNATIDSNFKGEKVELAKTRALSIATVMKIKMQSS